MIAPAGFLVGLVSVGEGGRDQSPDFSRDAAGEFDGQQDVHVHRHMVAVLLHGAYGAEDRNRAIADTAIIFRPWQFVGEDGITQHASSPDFISDDAPDGDSLYGQFITQTEQL